MDLDSVQLETFAAVIAEGSFEAAARRLHVTPSAVSQRIKALEQRLGQVLIRRGRPCLPTEAGTALVRLAGQVSLLQSEALTTIRGAGSGGATRIPVVVNADSLQSWFLPALVALPDDPLVCFELRTEDQDHSAELLRDGSVMAAVTADSKPVQGCRVVRLGAMRYLGMAAPSFASRWFADGVGPSMLAEAPMLMFNRKDMLQHRYLRRISRRRIDPPVHFVPSPWAFIEGIRLGLGWGMVPERIAAGDDRLVDLSPGDWVDVPLYWQHWNLDSPVLESLTSAVRAAAAAALR